MSVACRTFEQAQELLHDECGVMSGSDIVGQMRDGMKATLANVFAAMQRTQWQPSDDGKACGWRYGDFELFGADFLATVERRGEEDKPSMRCWLLEVR